MKRLSGLLVLLLSVIAVAGESTSASDERLKAQLAKQFPDIKVLSVHSTPWKGVYEVVTPDKLVYSDANGEHLFIGKMLDVARRENLTEQRWNDINRIDFRSLPFEQGIKVVKGDGSRQLAVFEDPLCPYCARLEKALQQLDNYTLHVFLLPLEDVHPGATRLARSIWCSADASAAWVAWMHHDVQPASRDCDSVPAAELNDLAVRLKVNATPTLYFADGVKVSGALSAEDIERRWSGIKR